MKYVTTRKKITHVVREDNRNGAGGYWAIVCGKWIFPVSLRNESSRERMCKKCKKYMNPLG